MKNRRICGMPRHRLFVPRQGDDTRTITLALEEYETIRLIDFIGCTQEECARQMAVGRTTVQGIYNKARQKLADALVNGYSIAIDGGMYELCQNEINCACGHCQDSKCSRKMACCGQSSPQSCHKGCAGNLNAERGNSK